MTDRTMDSDLARSAGRFIRAWLDGSSISQCRECHCRECMKAVKHTCKITRLLDALDRAARQRKESR